MATRTPSSQDWQANTRRPTAVRRGFSRSGKAPSSTTDARSLRLTSPGHSTAIARKSLPLQPLETTLADIQGVEDRFSGKTAHISGVQVVDPNTLKIVLDKPRLYFIAKLTYPCAFALCKEAVGTGSIDSPAQAMGAGPFKLESYQPDQQINLVPFKDYYDGMPSVDKVEQPVIKDPAMRMVKFKSGELDVLTLVRKDIPGVEADPKLKSMLHYETRPAMYYVGLNQLQSPVLRDRRVRRAIAQAIDRRRICHDLLEDVPEAHGLVSPGLLEYRPDYQGLPYNPTAAKAELAAAGYQDGQGFPPIELAYRDQAADAQIACEAIQQSLRQNLGINITMRTLEWSAMLQARNENKLQLYFLSWYADYLDAQNFLSFLLTSDAKLNHDGYKNAKFDALVQRGRLKRRRGQANRTLSRRRGCGRTRWRENPDLSSSAMRSL